MEMNHGRRRLALTFGFVECFLFGGTLMGWSSLVYVLKDSGIFRFLCQGNSTTNQLQHQINSTLSPRGDMTSDDAILVTTLGYYHDQSSADGIIVSNGSYGYHGSNTCSRVDSMLSLAFTLALVLCGVLAVPLGWMFDKFGLRYTRILGTIMAISGMMLIAFTGRQGSDWLIFPGIALCGLWCVTVIMTNCHICLLAGRHSFTLIAIYNGAVNMGAVVFLLGKILYEVGFPLMYFMCCLCGLWLLLVLPSTFLFLPKFKVEPDSVSVSNIVHLAFTSFTMHTISITPSSALKQSSKDNGYSNPKTDSITKETEGAVEKADFPVVLEKQIKESNNECKHQKPHGRSLEAKKGCHDKSFKQNVFSTYYLLYLWWYIVLYVRIQMFIMSYNAWVTDLMNGDIEKVSYFTNLLGYTQLAAFVVAPFAGLYMDKKRQSISMRAEYFSSGSEGLRGLSCVPSLTVASVSAILLSALVLVPTEAAVYGAVIVSEVYRGFLYATAVAYIKIMFPFGQYGRLFGVSYLLSGAAVFLQYPLFLWVNSITSGFQQVNLLLLVLACLTLVHPGYLLTSWYISRR